jgi:hypothetical protein
LIWIDAEADSGSIAGDSLLPGEGAFAKLRFYTTGDPSFAGYYSEVTFDFLDGDSAADNYFFCPDSEQINHSLMEFENGGVLIKAFDALIGDINLNGVAFEVADYVYFSNYFVDPFSYPLDGARWFNSDINQDGQPGTLSDLTYMEEIVFGRGPKLAPSSSEVVGEYFIDKGSDAAALSLEVDAALKAAFFKFTLDAASDLRLSPTALAADVDVKFGRDLDTLRVLLIGAAGHGFACAGEELLRFLGAPEIRLEESSCVDMTGCEVELRQAKSNLSLPETYDLAQNYPNPFNPQTKISFSLPNSGAVKLDVYNVLGQRVRSLVNATLPAGFHEVTFDSRDDRGQELASGVYFYRLQTNGYEYSRKMLLLK